MQAKGLKVGHKVRPSHLWHSAAPFVGSGWFIIYSKGYAIIQSNSNQRGGLSHWMNVPSRFAF
jgi:hypothetical protein